MSIFGNESRCNFVFSLGDLFILDLFFVLYSKNENKSVEWRMMTVKNRLINNKKTLREIKFEQAKKSFLSHHWTSFFILFDTNFSYILCWKDDYNLTTSRIKSKSKMKWTLCSSLWWNEMTHWWLIQKTFDVISFHVQDSTHHTTHINFHRWAKTPLIIQALWPLGYSFCFLSFSSLSAVSKKNKRNSQWNCFKRVQRFFYSFALTWENRACSPVAWKRQQQNKKKKRQTICIPIFLLSWTLIFFVFCIFSQFSVVSLFLTCKNCFSILFFRLVRCARFKRLPCKICVERYRE